MKIAKRIVIVSALAAFCAASGAATASASVSYVDSVYCAANGCEVQRKTVEVDSTVQERIAGDVCLQYRRRLTGFQRVPSGDPRTPIELPQFTRSELVQTSCGAKRPERPRFDLMSIR